MTHPDQRAEWMLLAAIQNAERFYQQMRTLIRLLIAVEARFRQQGQAAVGELAAGRHSRPASGAQRMASTTGVAHL